MRALGPSGAHVLCGLQARDSDRQRGSMNWRFYRAFEGREAPRTAALHPSDEDLSLGTPGLDAGATACGGGQRVTMRASKGGGG